MSHCKTGAQKSENYADKCERDQEAIIVAPREERVRAYLTGYEDAIKELEILADKIRDHGNQSWALALEHAARVLKF